MKKTILKDVDLEALFQSKSDSDFLLKAYIEAKKTHSQLEKEAKELL